MTWGMVHYVEWFVGGWLMLTIGVILFQVLTGRIVVAGMLSDDGDADLEIHRLQLFVVSMMFAAGYVAVALSHGGADRPDMPEIKPVLLLGLAGSQGAYLSRKIAWALRKRMKHGRGVGI